MCVFCAVPVQTISAACAASNPKQATQEAKKQRNKRGPQEDDLAPNEPTKTIDFPLCFSCYHQTRRFCARAPAAKSNTKQNQNRGPKVGVRHLLGAPRGFLEGHWLFKTMVLLRESIVFQKNEQNSAMHPKTQPENASRQSTTKLCSHNDKESL